jgi:DNA-binding NarL/FixJ family response regulator
VSTFQRKILVVEDEPLLAALIQDLLTGEGFKVATARNSVEARKVADELDPDLALLDIELGDGPSGIDLAIILREQNPGIGLVFLTHIPEPRVVGVDNRSIPKNAAYLVKDRIAESGLLRSAIDAALRDRVTRDLRDDKKSHALSEVSRSQLDVLKLVALGRSNHEIAEERGTTVRAVENLVKRALEAANIDLNEGNARVKAAREFIRVAGLPNDK